MLRVCLRSRCSGLIICLPLRLGVGGVGSLLRVLPPRMWSL